MIDNEKEVIRLAGKFMRDWLKANPHANNDIVKNRLEYYVSIADDLIDLVRN